MKRVCCYYCFVFPHQQTFPFKVILRRNGLLTARGSNAGGGGVIQIRSDADVQGMCESKFDVTGNTAGFVNILGE